MPGIFSTLSGKNHEELIFVNDNSASLRGIISIHSTALGPALGGLRVWNYANEQDAIKDALRLAEAMTYKAAAANLKLGGGKAVIIADPHKDKTPRMFHTMGRFIERLGGRYITAEDVGTSVADMEHLRETTTHVTGTSRENGGSGDPSPTTAAGVMEAIQACVEQRLDTDSLKGIKAAVQGIGHVGYRLCKLLHEAGAALIVSDVFLLSAEKAKKDFGAKIVEPENIYEAEADIFLPCALGGVLNDGTIPRLKCRIIAGAANNQLENVSKHGEALEKQGILYAPDYVANAGGLINIYYREILGMPCDKEAWSPTGIYENMKKVLEISKSQKIPTYKAADELALSRIEGKLEVKS